MLTSPHSLYRRRCTLTLWKELRSKSAWNNPQMGGSTFWSPQHGFWLSFWFRLKQKRHPACYSPALSLAEIVHSPDTFPRAPHFRMPHAAEIRHVQNIPHTDSLSRRDGDGRHVVAAGGQLQHLLALKARVLPVQGPRQASRAIGRHAQGEGEKGTFSPIDMELTFRGVLVGPFSF